MDAWANKITKALGLHFISFSIKRKREKRKIKEKLAKKIKEKIELKFFSPLFVVVKNVRQ